MTYAFTDTNTRASELYLIHSYLTEQMHRGVSGMSYTCVLCRHRETEHGNTDAIDRIVAHIQKFHADEVKELVRQHREYLGLDMVDLAHRICGVRAA